ncbi:MAG: hypothetical protein ACXVJD_13580, partial [Mucilaginibacter sp.]
MSILAGCHGNDAAGIHKGQADSGKMLAHRYCMSCHQFPEPSLIDKNTWVTGVLPAMAARFNLEHYGEVYMANPKSTISVAYWQSIVDYYKTAAPAKLVIPKSPSVTDWAIFGLERPPHVSHAPGNNANTSLLVFNPIDSQLYSADGRNHFFRWSNDLKPQLVATLSSPVTGATFLKTSTSNNLAVITTIGVLYPTDIRKGTIEQLDLDKSKDQKPVLIADSLPRSVQTVAADFNKDGLMDYVTCGFGR